MKKAHRRRRLAIKNQLVGIAQTIQAAALHTFGIIFNFFIISTCALLLGNHFVDTGQTKCEIHKANKSRTWKIKWKTEGAQKYGIKKMEEKRVQVVGVLECDKRKYQQ